MTKEELIELIRKSDVPVEKMYKLFMLMEEFHKEDMEEEKTPTP